MSDQSRSGSQIRRPSVYDIEGLDYGNLRCGRISCDYTAEFGQAIGGPERSVTTKFGQNQALEGLESHILVRDESGVRVPLELYYNMQRI